MVQRKRRIDTVQAEAQRKAPGTFWAFYAMLLARVFGDLSEDDELLQACYSPHRSRDFDEDFLPTVVAGVPGPLIVACRAQEQPDTFLTEYLQNTAPHNNHPFLIVGNAGTGKTTYLKHFFHVTIKELGLQNTIEGIIIDLRKLGDGAARDLDEATAIEKKGKNGQAHYPTLRTTIQEIETHIHGKVDEYLRASYPEFSSPSLQEALVLFHEELLPVLGLYSELERIRGKDEADASRLADVRELVKNTLVFNRARLRYIKTQLKRRIYLVVDNVDHFEKQSQLAAFNASTRLMDVYQLPLILATREYTVPSVFKHIGIAAYEPRALRLAKPDIRALLQKRVDYVLTGDKLNELFNLVGRDQIIETLPNGIRYEFTKTLLQDELNRILNSLVAEELLSVLDRLSGSDVRTLLRMTRVALSSGYLFPQERQEHYDRPRQYDLIRALMLGNHPVYLPNDSGTLIVNLLDNETPQASGNMLVRVRILQYLDTSHRSVHIEDCYRALATLGYVREIVASALHHLLMADLVESSRREGFDLHQDRILLLQLTSAGEYYVRTLLFNMTYVENLRHSTYVPEDYFEIIEAFGTSGKTKEERIENRFLATEAFT